jgi:hypothetical protein
MLPSALTFVLLVSALFIALLVCLEIGRRVRKSSLLHEGSDSDSGLSAIEGSVFGLMGLLLAFTFTGAAERFEIHRDLIVSETNAMETAWLRVDLLPPAAQPALRAEFRDYVDSRIGYFRMLGQGLPGATEEFSRGYRLQEDIWKKSVAATQQQNSPGGTMLVMSALNEMIDITRTRRVALLTHPPLPIYLVLLFLALASSVLAGYGMGKSENRNWTHILLYAATLAIAMYVILDLDYPRVGIIRIDTVDQIMVDLRKGMTD